MFVADTRPRRLLAFATHLDRAELKLRAEGWEILDWSATR